MYNSITRLKNNLDYTGRRLERMYEGMSNAQLNALLETLAKLIEKSAKTPEEAAQIVREAKTQ